MQEAGRSSSADGRDQPGGTGALRRSEAILLRASQGLAIAGGLVLVALALTTVYSIVGRALPSLPGLAWWRPVRGDFELVEMGTAVALFAFLPYAQITRANVLVDMLTARLPARAQAVLAVPAHLLLFGLASLVAWRMAIGTIALLSVPFPQTTMLLGLPLWWGYLPSTLCMGFLALVAAFTAWRSVEEALDARSFPR